MNTYYPIHILVAVPCPPSIRDRFSTQFGSQCHFTFINSSQTIPESLLRHTDVIIGEPDEPDLLKAPRLKCLQLTWAGADKYARMKRLPSHLTITNASGAFGIIISEYVIGTIIALYRSFSVYSHHQAAHTWLPSDNCGTIYKKTVLILGTGDIGSSLAHRLKAFDTSIIGFRRHPNHRALPGFDEVIGSDQLDLKLKTADIVVGCLPNTSETIGLFDEKRLRLMKKEALLINVGRGSLIKNDALLHVLKEGHLKGVALDVSEIEPLPKASPLWDLPNVFITPHIAGPSFGGNTDVEQAIWNLCFENIERFLAGQVLNHIVDLRQGY